ncbi:MAG: hypothetical protein RLY86_3293 [Pseudomonadota bacterium]|jgi:hypothetical protein
MPFLRRNGRGYVLGVKADHRFKGLSVAQVRSIADGLEPGV